MHAVYLTRDWLDTWFHLPYPKTGEKPGSEGVLLLFTLSDFAPLGKIVAASSTVAGRWKVRFARSSRAGADLRKTYPRARTSQLRHKFEG